jgi:hypothetical protein
MYTNIWDTDELYVDIVDNDKHGKNALLTDYFENTVVVDYDELVALAKHVLSLANPLTNE